MVDSNLNILGIFCGHDATAALLKNGEIASAIQEERLSRIKHQNGFPKLSIAEVIRLGGIKPQDIDYIAVGGNDRRIESVRELIRSLQGNRVYSSAGILKRIKTVIADNTRNYFSFKRYLKQLGLQKAKVIYIEHHLAHASSAYRNSGINHSLVLTVDGIGDDISSSVSIAKDGKIKRVAETRGKNSIGLFYQAATEALGFVPVEGEYKTMGLASYGDKQVLFHKLRDFITSSGMSFKSKFVWESAFKFPFITIKQREIFLDFLKQHRPEDLAAAVQSSLENCLLEFVDFCMKATHIKNICCAGGVFLNVKANQLIREELRPDSYYFHPDAGDAGLALGAAQQVHFQVTGQHTIKRLKHAYFGNQYSDFDIERELKTKPKLVKWVKSSCIWEDAAMLLSRGQVIGWFQGCMEMGPRALGNRSVLADPRNDSVKERINLYLKKRELFVPFAPSMLEEDVRKYIEDFKGDADFMIMAFRADKNFSSEIPAVVHVDGTLRPQIVKEETNSIYFKLLKHFKKITGIGVLLNTSFNRHGLPIVESPKDAIDHLIHGNVDCLAIGNFIVFPESNNIQPLC